MTLKKHFLAPALCAALGGLSLAGPASAGVISGTGAEPSSSKLGATDAVAFKVAEEGPGHALVVPYFTAQNGQMSVLHLVNTDRWQGKAVKLRWRGAGNADTLLDFTLLLAPGDAWTGTVHAGSDGRAQLVTADNSCTYPHLPQGVAQPFSTARLDPNATPARRAANTREGYVEVIVVADISSRRESIPSFPYTLYTPLYSAIRHFNGVAPCTQAVLDTALLADIGDEATAANLGLATPTGGLVGTWYIIDVPGSTTFSGPATAIQAVNTTGRPARGNFTLFPQTDGAVAAPERYTADPLLVSAGLASREKDVNGNTARPTEAAALTARFSDLPDLSTPYYLPAGALNARTTAGELSRALAVKSIANQYAIDASISAKTDWVLSLPTRRYSVGLDYSVPAHNALVFSVVPPANGGNNQYFHSGNTSVVATRVCRPGTPGPQIFADREATFSSGAGAFMRPPFSPALCGAVSVVAFADPGASALSADVTRETASYGLFTNGWSRLPLTDPTTQLGLPLLGSAFIKLTNPNAQAGVSGNYGITWPHILEKK